jgi:basic membrane protein A
LKKTMLALAVGLSFALAGCGGDDDEGAPATTAEPAEDAIKVGLVADQGQLNDRGFNQLAFQGLTRAEKELGIDGRVVESRTAADYIPNMTALARQGHDLIIGVGFAQGEAIAKVAVRFPESSFAIIDVDQASLPGKPKNVVGLLFKEQEVGYLAGYLAALEAQRKPGKNVLSSVGGIKEPPVDRFIAGYQAGAREAVPGVEFVNGYSQDWDDVAKCKELALNHIARGAEAIFQVAGGCGLGAIDAAGERDVWAIGVDADQSFLGGHVLTSALKRVDTAVFETIRSVQDGTFKGGRNLVFGLEGDGVGLGKVSPKVPKADLEKLEAVRARIAQGEVEIPTTVS